MTWPTKDDFVDGDVLTAAQVNNIADNLNLYDPTSATVGQVPIADGAGSVAFGTPPSGALVIMTPSSVSTSSGTATINTDGSIALSSASGLTVNGVFTSSKENYLVKFRVQYNTTGGNDWMRLTAVGVADTSNYKRQVLDVNSTTVSASQTSGASIMWINEPIGSAGDLTYTDVYIYGPQIAADTGFFSTSFNELSTISFLQIAGIHGVTSSFDGFTMSTGFQITGTATVYGFEI